jgi:hypothetical protein
MQIVAVVRGVGGPFAVAGGHVSGYDLEVIGTEDDRVVVKVVQFVD